MDTAKGDNPEGPVMPDDDMATWESAPEMLYRKPSAIDSWTRMVLESGLQNLMGNPTIFKRLGPKIGLL